MERIFNLDNNNLNFNDVLYEQLNKQYEEDLKAIVEIYSDGELEEKKDQLKHDYNFNLEKLEFIPELVGKDMTVQRKFVEISLYIDNMRDINKGNKLDAILTFGAAISIIPTHIELLDNDSAFILCIAMTNLPLNCYDSHGQIVSNPAILESVKAKSSNMDERRNMIYNMFEYCDDKAYEDMDPNDYQKSINDCLDIVKCYEVKEPNKTI